MVSRSSDPRRNRAGNGVVPYEPAGKGGAEAPEGHAGDIGGRRAIRSFVIRGGRMTEAQRRALAQYGGRYLLDFAGGPLDLDRLFGRRAPRTVEIGFGAGDALAGRAIDEPERDFLGIEVYPPGVGRFLARCHEAGIGNVRVAMADAIDVLERWIAPASVEEVLVWFPDPWPKKRHHKRRLVQPEFATLVHRALRPGGRLHLATDWEPYAEHMLEVLDAHPGFSNCAAPGRFMPRAARRRETRFESRGRRRGHRVFDLAWRAVAGDADTTGCAGGTPASVRTHRSQDRGAAADDGERGRMNLPLFVYGSMRDEDVRALVLGREPPAIRTEPAWMPGVAAVRVPGESYPYLVSSDGAPAPGELVHGLGEEDLDRILFFEGDEYGFAESVVERAGGQRVAAMHFGGVAIPEGPIVPWSLERWQAREKPRFLSMTREYMALWGRATQAQAEALWQRLIREHGAGG